MQSLYRLIFYFSFCLFSMNAVSQTFTTEDWAIWWANVEQWYADGATDEDLYWEIDTKLEELGWSHEEIRYFAENHWPEPYPGWGQGGGGGGGVFIPNSGPGSKPGKDDPPPTYRYKCDLMPGENRCPAVYADVEIPPRHVAHALVVMGGMLAAVPHPGTNRVGAGISTFGAWLLWLIDSSEEDNDEEDSN